ncbi:hypothetical protein E2C01_048009 [Portunus trituberculatus]|uniref:Uncharacterized protein n=1 Tax=Portunus trituberculatus TaxID=210409 RepID=A0A5B7G564_PORTR|nr:hypothetical protein [Portunus trituberculatus]
MRIEKAGGNREGAIVSSSLRQLCFCEEKKMRFSRREVVFHRSKTANVAEVNEEKVEGAVSRYFGSSSRQESDLGTLLVPFPEGDSEAGFGVSIF